MSALVRPSEPALLAAARAHLDAELVARWRSARSRGPELDPLLQSQAIKDRLLAMTGRTCAYCERAVGDEDGLQPMILAHHRPPWGAVGTDGSVDLTSYHWLSYEWTNLYPACADCVRTRGTRFPVAGPRATAGTGVGDEQAQLLDPCLDDPHDHLDYLPDGTVAARTPRGQVTIEVLALNRDSLVRARRRVLQRIHWGGDLEHDEFATLREQYAEPCPEGSVLPAPSAAHPADATDAGVAHAAVAHEPSYDLAHSMAQAEREHYFQTAQWIERVVIENFRPIRHVDIDLARSASERGPWTVLLGENGAGKSSILQAIALCMIGGRQRRDLGIDARRYLRYGARRGLVQVYLSGRPEPLELRWAKGDAAFTGPEPVPALLLGYGATRLLPREAAGGTDDRVVRVDNLFDPFLPLTDPTSWLLSLDEESFAEVAENISELLALDDDTELVRRRGQVLLRWRSGNGYARSDIRGLSDGYQSMLVLACDVLRTVLSMWPQAALAEGIVLIDELGAHLHPRWRMQIVTTVRRLMPRLQFVVTTHDPLCLRGVVDGEVVVVRRNSEGEVVTLADLPPVTGMRVEQLLTSEHFGLGSTDDPELDVLWNEYYALQGKERTTPAETARLDRVRSRLDRLEQLGHTERDRLLLSSADRFIARRRERGEDAVPSSAAVTEELAELWSRHLPGGA